MKQAWVLDKIWFNVPCLSMDCFPPSELIFEDLSIGPQLRHCMQGSVDRKMGAV